MGTAKRERQKANRQQRLQQLAKQARKDKSRRFGLRIGILIGVVIIGVGLIAWLGGNDSGSATLSKPDVSVPAEAPTTLVVTDLVEGTGDPAVAGDQLTVHYVGVRQEDGVEFDSNYDTDPFTFTLGVNSVIPGWDQGLVGVKAGGQRQLDIPSELAYGDTPSSDKPAGALTFVIDVVSVEPGAPLESTTTGVPPTTQVAVPAPTPCPAADGSSPRQTNFEAAPPMCIDPTKTYTATVVTNKGEFTIDLDAAKAPQTVNNFVVLSRYHFYDNVDCHRIIADFAAQCGDPTGTGQGGPGYSFADELPAAGEYKVGSIAMANGGPNTNGSQWFIILGAQGAALDPNYSLFGEVSSGMDTTVAAIAAAADPAANNGVPPLEPIIIQSITITES